MSRAYRSVRVEVGAHVLNLNLQLLLSPLGGALLSVSVCSFGFGVVCRTLKARCSRKCAVPLVSCVSALEPASIHMPTVDVWAHGE